MDDAITTNRMTWDEMAAIHAHGNASYPVAAFKAAKAGRTPKTPDDLGNVRGKPGSGEAGAGWALAAEARPAAFSPETTRSRVTVPPCQPRIRAVLFDLDGTLTDRPGSIATVAQRFVVAFADRLESVAVDPICREMLAADGHGYRPRGQFLAQLRDSIGWRERPDIEEITSFWQREFPLCTVEAEGMTTTLRSLHAQGLKLGIVSNGSTRVQNAKIDQLGLRPLLTTAVISETAGVKKPDRRIFEMALGELGLRPSDVAFVGDHPVNDVLAAQAMGMTGIWMRSGIDWPAGLPQPRLTVSRLADLRSLLPAT